MNYDMIDQSFIFQKQSSFLNSELHVKYYIQFSNGVSRKLKWQTQIVDRQLNGGP